MWPGVVFAIVPALGALLQGFVVSFLVLLNETLQAYVSADLQPQVVALQEQQKPGYTTVAVAKRVYAEKIQVEGGKPISALLALYLKAPRAILKNALPFERLPLFT